MRPCSQSSSFAYNPVGRRRSARGVALFCFSVVMAGLLGMACPVPAAGSVHPPLAKGGVIDLTDWDFEANPALDLQGEWKFYPNQLRRPNEYANDGPVGEPILIKGPGPWNGLKANGKDLPACGVGVYRLTMLLPKKLPCLTFDFGPIHTAYRAWANGVLIAKAGKLSRHKKTAGPEYRFELARYCPSDSKLDLIIQVSNFHHRLGGLDPALHVGEAEHFERIMKVKGNLDMFLIGVIFVMGVYHIGLYLLRRDDKPALCFGLFCLILMVRTMTTGQLYWMQLFPATPWPLLLRVEYLTFYLATPLAGSFFYFLYPKTFGRAAISILVAISAAFCLTVIFLPTLLFSRLIIGFQYITLISGVYVFAVLIRAAMQDLAHARLLAAGFVFFFGLAVNDILFAMGYVNTRYLVHFGLLGIIVVQAYVLAQRFSNSFRTVEVQRRNLELANVAYQLEIEERNKLSQDLMASNQRIRQIRSATILGLAKLAEYRDMDTGAHLERIQEYCRVLGRRLAEHPDYKDYIDDEYLDDLLHSSVLHDIGKVGVPDAILLKPGKLTEEEFEVVKEHTVIGGRAIRVIESQVKGQSFLTLGREVAYHHHERWDGTGYPDGLSGLNIPLSARLIALADVYDALTSNRPYKKAYSHDKSYRIILAGRGTHFDPDVVDAFAAVAEDFRAIMKKMKDS